MTSPVRGRWPALVLEEDAEQWWHERRWDLLAPVLFEFATSLLRRQYQIDYDVADDLAQQVILRCWQTGTVPDSPLGYVSRAVRNIVRDQKKYNYAAKRDDGHAAEVAITEATCPDPNPLQQILNYETSVQLRAAIRELPNHLRRPLVLHIFHRRTCRELAEQFGCKEGAMKMRLTRARHEFAKAYRRHEHIPLPAPWTIPR